MAIFILSLPVVLVIVAIVLVRLDLFDEPEIWVFAFMVVYFIGGVTFLIATHEEVLNPTVELREDMIAVGDGAMSISGNVSGGIFVTTTVINSSPMYTYYKQADDGAITQHQIPTRIVKVYEDTESEGYLTWEECHDFEGVTAWRLPVQSENCEGKHWKEGTKRNYEIHVPPGTVIRDFRLDAE